MAFSWSTLLSAAKSAITTISADAGPVLQAGEALAPVIGLIPGAGPIIAGAETAVATITSIAPTAIADATAGFNAVEKIIADGSPVITEFESIWDSIFHATVTPTGTVILTPKTSTATAPAASVAPPGNAVS